MKKHNLILLLIVLMFAATAFDCRKQPCDEYGGIKKGCYENKFKTNHTGVSPAGVRIDAFNDVPTASLPLYDEGFTKLFDISRRVYGYTAMLNHSSYRLFIHPTSSKCVNPGFVIPVTGLALWPDGWDNHPDFDKDPRPGFSLLCAAGMQFGADGALVADSPVIAATIARFEGEHLVLYHNDQDKYNETAWVHSHPILPDSDGSLSPEKTWEAASITLTEDVEAGSGLTAKKGSRVCVIGSK